MFKFIDGMPPDVMAIEAIGKITGEDYRNTLIPAAEAIIATGLIKMLYVIGEEFTGFGTEALWDDAAFGFKHWKDFTRIAVATDHPWLGAAVSMFKPFFRGNVRLFGLSELHAAKVWIVGPDDASA